LAVLSLGCSASFGGALRAYEHGRYPEAIEQLRDAEAEVAEWETNDRAKYALYRGLAHLALGDRPATLYWLGLAKRAAEADAAVFGDDDKGRLASAWAHLPLE
jgi:hypothetical protein